MPYSFGPWYTTGCTSPKLLCGGGEGIVHSSDVASHGFTGAGGPFNRLYTRLNRKSSCTAPVKSAAIGDELVQRERALHVVVGERRVAAHVAGEAEIVHRHEDAVDADEGQEEVPLPDRLVHHLAVHLREPEVRAGEDAEHRGDAHDEVEVADDEVRAVQVGVDRRLREEEAADAAADEHRDEAEAEERRGREAELRAVYGADPEQRGDGRRDRDDQRRHREERRRDGVHPAQEHVVSPHGVAQAADRGHAGDEHLGAEERLAREGRQDVRDDAEARQDRDVDLGMAEEPEEVLPEHRRAARVRLQPVADDEAAPG